MIVRAGRSSSVTCGKSAVPHLGWSVVGSGVLRVVEAGPWPARSPCPEGPWRLAGPGCREAASRSDAEGALDLGGTAPQPAQRPRTHPRKRHKSRHEHGADTVLSNDRDFDRFPHVKVLRLSS